MGTFGDANPVEPLQLQDRNSLDNTQTKTYDANNFPDAFGSRENLYRREPYVQCNSGDIDIYWLDRDGNRMSKAVNLQGGEDYSYNFRNKRTAPDGFEIESNQDGSGYLVLINRV